MLDGSAGHNPADAHSWLYKLNEEISQRSDRLESILIFNHKGEYYENDYCAMASHTI